MKLVSFLHNSLVNAGVLKDNKVVSLTNKEGTGGKLRGMNDILSMGLVEIRELAERSQSKGEVLTLDEVKLVAPVPRPGKVIGLAGNYSEHIKEVGLKLGLSRSERSQTVCRPFIMPPTVVSGPADEIPWPQFSKEIDYEVELAVVIGKTAKDLGADEAMGCIAGYTIANDVSARSVTFARGRRDRPWDKFYDWLNGKWADGFLPTGPYLLTRDEVENTQDLDMRLKVNGEVRQQSNTSAMIFGVEEIVAFLSRIMTLEPGDIIATGTPAGVGMAEGRFLKPGDRIEAHIEKLSVLRNTIGPIPEKFYEPLAEDDRNQSLFR